MWEPVLDGQLATDARRAVLDVARAIANHDGERRSFPDLTLFWAYVAGAFDDDWVSSQYDDATIALCSEVEHGFDNVTLYYGASGTGFALAHISEPGAADDILAAIDGVIARSLEVEAWTRDYDLINGLVGVGVYLLERGEAPTARAALDRLIGHLIATSETTPDGVAWHTAPELLVARQREQWPGGHFNCGLAHGVPGVIALLGRIAHLDPRVPTLATGTLQWLRARQLPGENGRYPASIARDDAHAALPARTAWCYGDPGVAIASWGASTRLGLPGDHALALARECATRPAERCGVVDAGLCHGAAGLAHIYNRFYQATGESLFRDAARSWFQRTLDLRRTDGVGGFAAWSPGADGQMGWQPTANLLEGAPGVALALLGGLQAVEPAWDRLLLCDLP